MSAVNEVKIPVEKFELPGNLVLPLNCTGVIAFAHGSGSSRFSARNRYVAQILNDAGFGTLLFDLLTEDEAADRENVFDIELLAHRLDEAIEYLKSNPFTYQLPIGLFGASTGAAAALIASVQSSVRPFAVVSRGGRPDLASPYLRRVTSPTLLIVGSRDTEVLELNRRAAAQMHCERQLEVVTGASHLFEEPGTLNIAALAARDWFASHLAAPAPRR